MSPVRRREALPRPCGAEEGSGAPSGERNGSIVMGSAREWPLYDLKERRLIDEEITRRTIDFTKRSVTDGKPFYAYVALHTVHPSLPNPSF